MKSHYTKGIEEGIEQGILQGIVQGIEQIAMNMMTSFDDESIHLATGIDVEMIKKLRSEHEC